MSLSFIKTWVFDLDNTLYPPEENIFSQIDEKMTSFIAENLKISHEEALIFKNKILLIMEQH